jgi:hypothetical protein
MATVRNAFPPNPHLAAPSFQDVTALGPPRPKGEPLIQQFPVRLRIEGPALPGFPTEGMLGRLVPYRLALLFIPDPTLGKKSLKEFLHLYADAVFGPVVGGALDVAVPGLGLVPRALAETFLHGRVFPEQDPGPVLSETFAKYGCIPIPWIDLIEIGGERDLIHGDKGLTLALGGPAGDRTTVTARGQLHSTNHATNYVGYRLANEQSQMFWVGVQKVIWAPLLQQAVEEKWTIARLQGAVANADPWGEVSKRPAICRAQLDLLEPLRPAYPTAPPYAKWIQDLEACASGHAERCPAPMLRARIEVLRRSPVS